MSSNPRSRTSGSSNTSQRTAAHSVSGGSTTSSSAAHQVDPFALPQLQHAVTGTPVPSGPASVHLPSATASSVPYGSLGSQHQHSGQATPSSDWRPSAHAQGDSSGRSTTIIYGGAPPARSYATSSDTDLSHVKSHDPEILHGVRVAANIGDDDDNEGDKDKHMSLAATVMSVLRARATAVALAGARIFGARRQSENINSDDDVSVDGLAQRAAAADHAQEKTLNWETDSAATADPQQFSGTYSWLVATFHQKSSNRASIRCRDVVEALVFIVASVTLVGCWIWMAVAVREGWKMMIVAVLCSIVCTVLGIMLVAAPLVALLKKKTMRGTILEVFVALFATILVIMICFGAFVGTTSYIGGRFFGNSTIDEW